jgi:hypothetical protein
MTATKILTTPPIIVRRWSFYTIPLSFLPDNSLSTSLDSLEACELVFHEGAIFGEALVYLVCCVSQLVRRAGEGAFIS